MSRTALALLAALLSVGGAAAEIGPFSKDLRITPERLGLPDGNERTSEPFVVRVYKTDESGGTLKKQPKGYPFSLREDHRLAGDEAVRVHEGVDVSSRPAAGMRPVPLDFTAGVHGVVVKAGDGPLGLIGVATGRCCSTSTRPSPTWRSATSWCRTRSSASPG